MLGLPHLSTRPAAGVLLLTGHKLALFGVMIMPTQSPASSTSHTVPKAFGAYLDAADGQDKPTDRQTYRERQNMQTAAAKKGDHYVMRVFYLWYHLINI